MYDPVLNRPMFQGPSSTAQGSSTPSAKGTGITSMVTAPDQGAQQLKTFSTQIAPTIRGFAEGGYLSDSSSPMQGQNPLQSSISQAIDQSLYQQPQGYAGGGVASMWDNFVNSLTVKGETTSPFQGPTPMRKENYERPGLPDIGLRIGQQNDYRRDAGITGGGANYVEPIDVGGKNAEPRVPNVDAERRELVQSVDRFFNPTPEELAGREAKMDEQRNKMLASGVSPEDVSRMLPRPTPARPPSVQNFENPYRNDNTSDRFEREQIERMKGPPPPPPVPQERPPVEERSSISTELAKIKEDRKAQSAADRRENALMALMSAGFGMAAGKSRHALTNIAEGGQQGIASFAALERARREDENRRYLSDLQQRQLELHERELKAKEPLYAAQTEAQKSLPGYRAQIAATREDLARQRAIEQASKEYDNILKNGTSNEAMRIMADKTNTVGAAIKQDLIRKHFQLEMRKDQVQQYDSQNIRPSNTSE